MSQIYTARQKAAQPQKDAGPAPAGMDAGPLRIREAVPPDAPGSRASRLDEQMQERFRQHFLSRQIPRAEQEADRLSSGMEDARTPEEVKARLGQRMGADFSGVRFHTDSAAVSAAEGIGARAYASGRDIYFGEGGFDPSVAAHELVHTVQQGLVESSAPTVSAPAGTIQMMPKLFEKIGGGIAKAAKAVGHGIARGAKAAGSGIKKAAAAVGRGIVTAARTIGHGIAKPATGIWEFAAGKAGLLNPSDEQRDEAMAKARSGDYSQFASLREADAQSLVDAEKANIRAGSLPDLRQAGAAEMLNPVNRMAMSQLAGVESLPKDRRLQIR